MSAGNSWETVYPDMRRAALRALGANYRSIPVADHEDIADEAIAKIIEKYPDATEVDNPEALAATFADNLARNEVRKNKRHALASPTVASSGDREQYSSLEALEKEIAREAVAELGSAIGRKLEKKGIEHFASMGAADPEFETELRAFEIYRTLLETMWAARDFISSQRDVRGKPEWSADIGGGAYADRLRMVVDLILKPAFAQHPGDLEREHVALTPEPNQWSSRTLVAFNMTRPGSMNDSEQLPTDRELALISLLAGNRPHFDLPISVEEIIRLEALAMQKARQRAPILAPWAKIKAKKGPRT